MKKFLRGGRGLSKVLTLPMIICVLFSSALVVPAFGQETDGPAKIKPLQIGDAIPEELWNMPLQVVNHPEGKDTIRLNDYREKKLIILDFWATWCKTCLETFPKMEKFQNIFDNQAQFLMVNAIQTKDSNENIERTLAKVGVPQDVPFINRDLLFQQYFPHRILPHYVWISGEGTYLGSTSQREVNEETIRSTVNQGLQDVHLKSDRLDFHASVPLLAYLNKLEESPLLESSLFTGYIEGIGNSTGFSTINNELSRLYLLNSSLSHLFRMAYREELMGIPNNRLLFEEAVPRYFVQQYLTPDSYKSQYTYEVIKKTPNQVDLYKELKQTLKGYFGVTVQTDTVKVSIWYIDTRMPNKIKGGIEGEKMTFGGLVHRINNQFRIPIIISKELEKEIVLVTSPTDSLDFSEEKIAELMNHLGFVIKPKKEYMYFARFVRVEDSNETNESKEVHSEN